MEEGIRLPREVSGDISVKGTRCRESEKEDPYVYDVGATREDRGQWERDEGMVCPARDAHQTEAVLDRQLIHGLAGLSADTMTSLSIAYEPVWAIGGLQQNCVVFSRRGR